MALMGAAGFDKRLVKGDWEQPSFRSENGAESK